MKRNILSVFVLGSCFQQLVFYETSLNTVQGHKRRWILRASIKFDQQKGVSATYAVRAGFSCSLRLMLISRRARTTDFLKRGAPPGTVFQYQKKLNACRYICLM